MKDEFKRLREELSKARNSKEFDDRSDEEIPLEKEEQIPPDQRLLVRTLKSFERRMMDDKLDLPTYDGRMNPDAAIDWVDGLNSFFECDEILENQRTKIAKSKLKGTALTWWNITQGDRVKNGKGLVTTWTKMEKLFRKAYVLADYEVQLHRRRMNLRKKQMTVLAYNVEFQALVMRKQEVESKSIKLTRYLKGLKLSMQDELSLAKITTVQQCVQLALRVEEKFKRINEQSNRRRGRNDRGKRNYPNK